MKVAIQGDKASFHDTAAQTWFGDYQAVSCDSFPGVFAALTTHTAEAAIVAIENSLFGGINQVYDLIEAHGYPIVGEIHLPIHQQLIGVPNTAITHIYSHPVALAQCQLYLDEHYPDAERIEHHDTAAAVEFIKVNNLLGAAAIASQEAAKLHDMDVLRENIEDNPANFTRFLVIQPGGHVPAHADRTSLVLTTDHAPGALAKILTTIAEYGINLSKLQSRPIIGKPWKYKFYLVLDAAGEELEHCLSRIRPLTDTMTVLGEYKHDSPN